MLEEFVITKYKELKHITEAIKTLGSHKSLGSGEDLDVAERDILYRWLCPPPCCPLFVPGTVCRDSYSGTPGTQTLWCSVRSRGLTKSARDMLGIPKDRIWSK